MRHVMIDLETMGTRPDSAIVSVGAVRFDPRLGQISKRTFYRELDWEEQGRKIDPDTQSWWIKQSNEAQLALYGIEELSDALVELADYLPKDAKVWGNGPTFDITMLENAYMQHNISIPWRFWNIRDCRTMKDLFEWERGGFGKNAAHVKHNALDDALAQAADINRMWAKLKL